MEDGINISNYCTYDGGMQIMISSSKSDKVKIMKVPERERVAGLAVATTILKPRWWKRHG